MTRYGGGYDPLSNIDNRLREINARQRRAEQRQRDGMTGGEAVIVYAFVKMPRWGKVVVLAVIAFFVLLLIFSNQITALSHRQA